MSDLPETDDLLQDFERLATESYEINAKAVVLGDVREIVKNELVRAAVRMHNIADAYRNAGNDLAARADEI